MFSAEATVQLSLLHDSETASRPGVCFLPTLVLFAQSWEYLVQYYLGCRGKTSSVLCFKHYSKVQLLVSKHLVTIFCTVNC